MQRSKSTALFLWYTIIEVDTTFSKELKKTKQYSKLVALW